MDTQMQLVCSFDYHHKTAVHNKLYQHLFLLLELHFFCLFYSRNDMQKKKKKEKAKNFRRRNKFQNDQTLRMNVENTTGLRTVL